VQLKVEEPSRAVFWPFYSLLRKLLPIKLHQFALGLALAMHSRNRMKLWLILLASLALSTPARAEPEEPSCNLLFDSGIMAMLREEIAAHFPGEKNVENLEVKVVSGEIQVHQKEPRTLTLLEVTLSEGQSAYFVRGMAGIMFLREWADQIQFKKDTLLVLEDGRRILISVPQKSEPEPVAPSYVSSGRPNFSGKDDRVVRFGNQRAKLSEIKNIQIVSMLLGVNLFDSWLRSLEPLNEDAVVAFRRNSVETYILAKTGHALFLSREGEEIKLAFGSQGLHPNEAAAPKWLVKDLRVKTLLLAWLPYREIFEKKKVRPI